MPTEKKSARTSRRRHLPAGVFIAVATALGIFVALLPRTGNQPPPPTVAEFAPQAAKAIRNADSNQSSQFGKGGGACADGQVCDDNGKPIHRPTIDVPRVKQCYEYPDGHGGVVELQSPDPQSPPCIPYWDGPPGGNTWQGVTSNTITVAMPYYAFENQSKVKLFEDYFNSQFQFYNRKIVIVPFSASGGLSEQPNPDHEIADAKYVDETVRAFASLSTGGRFGSEHIYYDELARRGVLSVAHRAGTKTTEAYLDSPGLKSLRWSVVPGMDTMQAHMAHLLCDVLRKNPPIYAGPGISGSERTYGLVYGKAADGSVPDLDRFRHAVAACGISLAVDTEDVETDQTHGTNTILKLIEKNVTSVVCFCEASQVRGPLMQNATAQQYRPEWVVSTYIDNDVDNSFGGGNAPPDQAQHVIGLSFRNRWLPSQYMPWYWAFKKAHPEIDVTAGESYDMAARYSSLLLLASGIQEAGPTLTPATFEAGLQRTIFPNPGAGGPPYYQAWVGFPNGSHTMMHDSTMYWFDPSAQGTVDPTNAGAVCYVDQGKRYKLEDWHRQAPAFYQASCR